MRHTARRTVTKGLQKLFWIYHTKNFVITRMSDFRVIPPATGWDFVPIARDNCFRVEDFRDDSRISEYRDKLAHGEIGFFADASDRMVGSIWATINSAGAPTVVKSYMRLMPNEALIHDIVTSETFRGKGVGPFMVGQVSAVLLNVYRVNKIIIDVNVRNKPSLRMMEKAGVPLNQEVIYISALGRLMLQKMLKQH